MSSVQPEWREEQVPVIESPRSEDLMVCALQNILSASLVNLTGCRTERRVFDHPVESNRDPRVDRYIAEAAEFARPILREIRSRVHVACPEIEETIKWSMPFFVMANRPVCLMAAFKQHCAFRFWHRGMKSVLARGGVKSDSGMSSFGPIRTVRDLPPKRDFGRYVKAAGKLTETKLPKRSRSRKVPRELTVPSDLADALSGNAPAAKTFNDFSYGHRKEYIEWVTTAKRPETRTKRLASTLEWLAQGKPRNWKYGA